MTTKVLTCDTHKCQSQFDIESKLGSLMGAREIVHQFGWRVIDGKDICPKCIFLQFGKDRRALERCDLHIIQQMKEVANG